MFYQVTVLDKFDCVSSVSEFDTLDEAKEEASKYKNAFVERVEEDITEQLIGILPNGSGINFDYEIEQKGKRIYIRNAWDYMDENGFYDDVFPFVVCYENGRFKYLHFIGCTRTQYRKIEYAGLRDYLEWLFTDIENKIAVAMGLDWELVDIGENGYMIANE